MSMKKVRLIGCARYNRNGSLFLKNEVNLVSEEQAHALLNVYDDHTGYAYFEEVVGDVQAVAPRDANQEEDFPKAAPAVRKVGRPRKAPAPVVHQNAESGQPVNSDGIIEV
jgi:hypothetical protein